MDQNNRQWGIGGSDAPVIVLGSYFGKTSYDLWLEKTGRIDPVDLNNPDIRRGKRQEPIAAQIYEEKTGNKVRRLNKTLIHPEIPFIFAHIDREILGKDAILEIKCPRSITFNKWKLAGIPEGPQIQGQHYLAVKGKGLVVFAVYCAETDELLIVPVERDQELIDLIIEKEIAFWECVEKDYHPPPAEERIVLPPIGGRLEIMDDNREWNAAAEALHLARSLRVEAQELEVEARERIISLMNGNDVAEGGGLRVYHRWQEGRKTFDGRRIRKGNPFQTFRPYFLTENKERDT